MVKTPRKRTRLKKTPPPPTPPPQPPSDDGRDPKEERPEFHAFPVTLLHCTPGNYDSPEGEPATIATVAKRDGIEPLVFNMCDTRKLVVKMLVSLATYDDKFAEKVLDDHFPADAAGNFIWPTSTPGQN